MKNDEQFTDDFFGFDEPSTDGDMTAQTSGAADEGTTEQTSEADEVMVGQSSVAESESAATDGESALTSTDFGFGLSDAPQAPAAMSASSSAALRKPVMKTQIFSMIMIIALALIIGIVAIVKFAGVKGESSMQSFTLESEQHKVIKLPTKTETVIFGMIVEADGAVAIYESDSDDDDSFQPCRTGSSQNISGKLVVAVFTNKKYLGIENADFSGEAVDIKAYPVKKEKKSNLFTAFSSEYYKTTALKAEKVWFSESWQNKTSDNYIVEYEQGLVVLDRFGLVEDVYTGRGSVTLYSGDTLIGALDSEAVIKIKDNYTDGGTLGLLSTNTTSISSKETRFRFIPSWSGDYVFSAQEIIASMTVKLYDCNMSVIGSYNGNVLRIRKYLNSDEEYYLGIKTDSGYNGSYSIDITVAAS